MRNPRRKSPARTAARSARLEARVTNDQKALIERAAAYQGRTVSDFVVGTLSAAAEAIVGEREVILLNPAQSIAFVQSLLDPPAPNAALRKAARAHRKSVESR